LDYQVTGRFQSPSEPLVEKNPFRENDRPPVPFPDVAELRSRLPIPVLPEDPAWERLYWSAWDALRTRFRLPAPGSHLIAAYPQPKSGGNLEMGAASFVAQIAGYLPGPYRLIGLLDNFYARQHADGFICRELEPETGDDFHSPYEPNSTGPNLLAWAEWRHFRLTGDQGRIAGVFWPLLAYQRWRRANRTWPNGLYWATGYSSGLINQPRVPGGRFHHLHWAWVDATAQAAHNLSILERMAAVLGEETLAAEVAAEHNALVQTFNAECWNDATHFYQDVGPDGHFSPVKSLAAYWTLLDARLVPRERLTPFVQHLRDTWSFRTQHVLPSLPADDEAYNARTGNGFRGGVWPSLTYMVLRGLQVADQHVLAHKLALSHVDTVTQVHETTGCLWENYAPEDLGPGEPAEEDTTGQTAAAVIGMILENVLGLSVDWPLRQVTWRRYLERTEAYGVRNWPLGDEGTLDLLSAGDSVQIRTDAPITLALHNGAELVQTAVPAGAFTIDLD
jgi:hypothetical protein